MGAGADAFTFRPIGVIRTDFKDPDDAPRQGALMPEAKGVVELDPALAEGLETRSGPGAAGGPGACSRRGRRHARTRSASRS
jgi:hypothetical protein